MQTNKKLSLAIATLFNVLAPGFGYIYVGLPKKWLIYMGIAFVNYLITMFFIGIYYNGLLLSLIISLIIYLFAIVDVAKFIKAHPVVEMNRWMKPSSMLGLFVLLMIVGLGAKKLARLENFVIPSGSMCPALHIGDRFIVEKRVPVVAGDIVVFRSPKDQGIHFAKRVVAVGGDKVLIQKGNVAVNGQNLFISPLEYNEKMSEGCGQDFEKLAAKAFKGQVGQSEMTFLLDGHTGLDDTVEIMIPPGQYFVMGDNYNNSMDSRLIGSIVEEDIIGKALYVAYSFNHLTVAWDRFGLKL